MLKDAGVPAMGVVAGRGIDALTKVVTVVVQLLFLSGPTVFEAAQAVVGQGGAAEMEIGKLLRDKVFDGGPHYQIIGAQFLGGEVRGPIFVECLGARGEKDVGGYGFAILIGFGYETQPACDYMLINGAEEAEWLWWQTVALAREAVKLVKHFHAGQGGGDADFQLQAFGFADGSTNGALETVKEVLGTGSEIQGVSEKRESRG